MSLLTNLQWYWDLSSADANIVDQHNGLSLGKVGTVTTSATGGPDDGPCIDCGNAAGKYRNASVNTLASYNTNWSVNIWVKSTDASNVGNWVANHRGGNVSVSSWQLTVHRDIGDDRFSVASTTSFFTAMAEEEDFNKWQMITGVRRGSNIELWRNGILLETTAFTGDISTGGRPFAIGGNAWNGNIEPGLNHRGQLAMAGVWNEALAESQILSLFNSGSGKRYADLATTGTIQTRRRRDLGGYGL